MASTNLGQVAFRPMGAYDAGVTYHRLDMVGYTNVTWVARREVRGEAPIEGEDWMQLVEGVAGPEGPMGPEGPAGKDGSGVSILGSYPTLADLEAAHSSGSIGDAYLINGEMYIWDENGGAWLSVGTIQGPKGADGKDGEPGPRGADGKDGEPGPRGADGLTTSVNGVTQVDGEILLNAADIPTTTEGVSVQAALDAHTSEIAALYPEIATITLPADAWTQNGDIWEQVASHEIFVEYGYLYDPVPISAQILTVADLGGIVMDDSISDGSAIFQCPRMPGVDIDMRILRNVQKEEG